MPTGIADTGVPVPDNFIDMAFWLLTTATGQLWRRFIKPYSLPPLSLARLQDSTRSLDEQKGIATSYCNRSACCRSVSFDEPLHLLGATPEDLMLEGRLGQAMSAVFRTKPTNIEAEDNFSRAQSAKMATRGRSDSLPQFAAKHILAELKQLHRKDFMRANAGSYLARDSNLVPVEANTVFGEESRPSAVAVSHVDAGSERPQPVQSSTSNIDWHRVLSFEVGIW